MLHLLFQIFIGKFAPITSGVLGILGSIALAVPPIESRHLRIVLLKLEEIEDGLAEAAYRAARLALTREARRLLERERHFNLAGAGLLFVAFAILLMNAIHDAL